MLEQLQREFSAYLRRQDEQVFELLAPTSVSAQQAMQIYRNNYVASLSEALQASYPTVLQLVGEESFDSIARAYLAKFGHNSGDLNRFGEHFAEFTASLPELRSLDYLCDVARFDWLMEQVSAAPHSDTPFDVAALSSVSEAQFIDLVFNLRPQLALFASAHPIVTIHQMVSEQQVEAIELNTSEYAALIKQPDFSVRVLPLSASEHRFLQHCQRQRPLAELDEECLEQLQALLGMALQQQLLSGFNAAAKA
ncbi:DNA-binding domain-containing protein [Aliagarivorans marinus]|uniref:HvfC/BufC N-terminal domain-containing protein n=1 Tax=Aliagarivorans marinus TaxID=561965 RepID=UPI0004091389|nr:DNA-binding domain-containing protein [Aliagarivorans marinus]